MKNGDFYWFLRDSGEYTVVEVYTGNSTKPPKGHTTVFFPGNEETWGVLTSRLVRRIAKPRKGAYK